MSPRKKTPVESGPEKKARGLYELAIILTLAAVFLCVVYTASAVSMIDAKIQFLDDKMSSTASAQWYSLELQKAGNSPFCYVYNAQGQKMFGVDESKVTVACNVTG
jgi:hypothetical protein